MRLARNPDLVAAEMDGDLVMMSIENGTYYGLSGIAPRIWEVLETPHSEDELMTDLLARYDVTEDVLRADLDRFLEDMRKNGLVRTA